MSPTISSVLIEADDVATAEAFYAALGLADRVQLRPAEAPASGFRGFTLSLVVPGPGNADAYVQAAAEAGASVVKSPAKSFWGYGGSFRAPDGTVWTVASSKKKDPGSTPSLQHDELVLLLGVEDVKATKSLYVDRGLDVGRSFGSKYVEFEGTGPVKLALQSRRAVAKNAGVDADGSGSHRLVIRADAPPFTDPDGYVWEQVTGE